MRSVQTGDEEPPSDTLTGVTLRNWFTSWGSALITGSWNYLSWGLRKRQGSTAAPGACPHQARQLPPSLGLEAGGVLPQH